MDLDAVAAAISEADVMATAVGVNILPRIVSPLVAGFRLSLIHICGICTFILRSNKWGNVTFNIFKK